MQEYNNDQEQWEAIKTWWKANGMQLVAVIVLGLVISFGYQFWQQHKAQQAEKASFLYDQMLAGYANGSMKLFADLAKELEDNFSATPYAGIAALFEAKIAAEKGNSAGALQKLQWAMDHARGDSFRQIARLRAARILLAQQKPDAALSLLQKVDNKGYLPAINLVKGDIYLAQSKMADARTAYQAALQAIPADQPLHADLQMRIIQLPS
ncbi:MAG TPA: tetratricopeptide repeat protein [Gammaproteobacteria bacterium]|nr:tetratricopeptide repeat protein [Gammaproteobacteria bacterium]